MGLKSGVAEWEFETYLVKFETYSVIQDYETKKTAGAAEPPEPPSLAPMEITMETYQRLLLFDILWQCRCNEIQLQKL